MKIAAVLICTLAALFLVTPAMAGVRVERDAYCIREDGVSLGVVLAGTEVEVLEQLDGKSLIYSERHKSECWIDDNAFLPRGYIHPDDLEATMRWQTMVERWMPEFETLTPELVLSVIYKETKGNPHAVDQTGNDVAMVGQASVGLMGAIPRPHLPCYETLTGSNGKDEYGCQVYLGMWILDSAIRQAHDLRIGGSLLPPVLTGTLPRDTECSTAVKDGSPVGWLLGGMQIDIVKAIHNDAGELSHARVYSEKHGRYCWVSLDGVELEMPSAIESEDVEITSEDIEMGLWLYGCTLENVLADNCLAWGRETYSDLVLETILPEIRKAMQ